LTLLEKNRHFIYFKKIQKLIFDYNVSLYCSDTIIYFLHECTVLFNPKQRSRNQMFKVNIFEAPLFVISYLLLVICNS